MYRWAEEIPVIERSPRIRLIKVGSYRIRFLDFDEYEALVAAAKSEPEWRAAILLAGDAGLRLGELMALEWKHWGRTLGKLYIEQSFSKGKLGPTKGYNLRTIPMTQRLRRALAAIRHLKGSFVLCQPDGSPLTVSQTRAAIPRLCAKAGIQEDSWHPLKHTFCSHLAMKGAPAKTIQSSPDAPISAPRSSICTCHRVRRIKRSRSSKCRGKKMAETKVSRSK
jgi:integrase